MPPVGRTSNWIWMVLVAALGLAVGLYGALVIVAPPGPPPDAATTVPEDVDANGANAEEAPETPDSQSKASPAASENARVEPDGNRSPKSSPASPPATAESNGTTVAPSESQSPGGLQVVGSGARLDAEEKKNVAIFRRCSPSVVHITTLVSTTTDFFGLDVEQVPEGTGSGFVWDDSGHIVTNYHVIRGAEAAQVTLADRTTWPAKLVGVYADGDVAVLRLDRLKTKLPPLAIGTSHDLEVGQKVFAIGNPFGLDHTLTTGIVSALGRQVSASSGRRIKGIIQIDAAINPGNSGGPLLDSAGRLIGVNSAILSPSGAFAGIGFAIPVDKVKRVVSELIKYGKVVEPTIGVEPAPDQWVKRLGLKGVLVLNVASGSPAAKAGIRPMRRTSSGHISLGDLIVALDGTDVESADDYLDILQSHRVGDSVSVTLKREGQRQKIRVPLVATE